MRFKFAPRLTVSKNRKPRRVARKIDVPCLPFGIVRSVPKVSICVNSFPSISSRTSRTTGESIPTISRPFPGTRFISRENSHLISSRSSINIGVVEFDIVDDRDLRQVVHEFRLFVEICRVVFVALDDKMIAVGHAKARAEILNDPADEKARIQPADLAHPRRDARRRRLAVRPGNDQRAPARG